MKVSKKGDFEIPKSQITISVLNQSPISAAFPIVRFAGDPNTALTEDSLYFSTSTTWFTIIGHSFIDCIEFLADFSKQNGLKYEVVRKKPNI